VKTKRRSISFNYNLTQGKNETLVTLKSRVTPGEDETSVDLFKL